MAGGGGGCRVVVENIRNRFKYILCCSLHHSTRFTTFFVLILLSILLQQQPLTNRITLTLQMQILNDKPKLLSSILGVQSLFTICFFFSSLAVSSTANNGFNVVLDALLYAMYCLGGLYVLNRSQSGLAVGFLIGVACMTTINSLKTAIFWGQLTGCEETVDGTVPHYSCSHIGGYRAICVFSIIMFVLSFVFTYILVEAKDEIVEGNITKGYDNVGASSFNSGAGAAYQPQQNSGQPITADL